MDDFTNIFDPLDSQTASDEDQGLATAGEILVKLAEEEGIDLDQLSETELLGLVNTLRGDGTTNLNDTEPRKEASHTMDENQITEAQFDALVMQETAKVAAAHEIDITALSVEDLAELRHAVASEIAEDPDAYFAKTAAEEEFQAKLAEADYIGRFMAHSFADELGLEKLAKINLPKGVGVEAGSAQHKDLTEQQLQDYLEARGKGGPKAQSLGDATLGRVMRGDNQTGSKALPASTQSSMARNARLKPSTKGTLDSQQARALENFKSERSGFKGLFTRGSDAAARLGRKLPGAGVVRDPRARLAIAAGLGTAAAGGAAYGAKKLMDKESTLDDLAMERAQEILAAQGIDLETGEKVAYSEAEIDEAISIRALELLEEQGWTFE